VSSQRPDIFTYNDYQAFLKDWLAFKKASQSGFSLRALAKRAGLATGYLPMVLGKKRPLSAAVLEKIMPFLGLSSTEKSYLESLLKFRNAGSNEQHVAALGRMKRFQKFQDLNPEDTEVSEYLTHWYYVAIRELASVPGFKPEPLWIQDQLKFTVPLGEIKQALEFLLKNAYLVIGADGGVQPPNKSLNCSGDVFRVALAKFHREILQLATQAIETVPREQREIQGHTCSLSSQNFSKAKLIIDEAMQKIRDLGDAETQASSVFHMEIALIPLTGKKVSGK
jgi:uncharacterized protein (TIGR02147 family)